MRSVLLALLVSATATGEERSTLSVGREHVCATDDKGRVFCWGNLRGPTDDSEAGFAQPTQVPGLADVAQVASGDYFACARSRDGKVHCFTMMPKKVNGAGVFLESPWAAQSDVDYKSMTVEVPGLV